MRPTDQWNLHTYCRSRQVGHSVRRHRRDLLPSAVRMSVMICRPEMEPRAKALTFHYSLTCLFLWTGSPPRWFMAAVSVEGIHLLGYSAIYGTFWYCAARVKHFVSVLWAFFQAAFFLSFFWGGGENSNLLLYCKGNHFVSVLWAYFQGAFFFFFLFFSLSFTVLQTFGINVWAFLQGTFFLSLKKFFF